MKKVKVKAPRSIKLAHRLANRSLSLWKQIIKHVHGGEHGD